MINQMNNQFIELHSHLYGCLDAETLFKIGLKNPNPRWNLFIPDYEKLFQKKINSENFFSDYSDIQSFKDLYYFSNPSSFSEFQAKFNLIIALSKFDIEEIYQVSEEVLKQNILKNIVFSEFRIMYSTLSTEKIVQEKTKAMCEGLSSASSYKGIGRAVVSLHRDKDPFEQYKWLKELMVKSKSVQETLVGLDFCHIEEGFPPDDKISFFEEVLKDNKAEPESSLSILYHVGESFKDKTPQSTCRWIIVASESGSHRLGHCIALGLPSKYFLNKTINEVWIERKKYLEFLIERYEEIREFGEFKSKIEIEYDYKKILHSSGIVQIEFRDIEVLELEGIQNYCFHVLKKQRTVVETCPTSNRLIGGILEEEYLPIHRFIQEDVPLTIGSDDPGILNTDLILEYDYCLKLGISKEKLEKIQRQSFLYTSEKLSGRPQNEFINSFSTI
jgi:adenosine deaminase